LSGYVKSVNHRGHEGSQRKTYVACDEQDLGPWSLRGVWWFAEGFVFRKEGRSVDFARDDN